MNRPLPSAPPDQHAGDDAGHRASHDAGLVKGVVNGYAEDDTASATITTLKLTPAS